MLSDGQVMSWYHSKILRIPHGNQNPTKRYLTDKQIIEFFTGLIVIEEKVDGKQSIRNINNKYGNTWEIFEDMTGKNTCHHHVMKYDKAKLPYDQRIILDRVYETSKGLVFESPFVLGTKGFSQFTYAKLNFKTIDIKTIYNILDELSKLPSHFGSPVIEGLVIKNYDKQLMGKWINEEFEDKLDK